MPIATPGRTILGEPSGHGTWTYEAIQEGLVSPAHTVQIGLRSAGERAALVAFLGTLTDNTFLTDGRFSNPFGR